MAHTNCTLTDVQSAIDRVIGNWMGIGMSGGIGSHEPTSGPEQFRGKARFKREPRNKKSHAWRIIHVLLSLPQRRRSASFLKADGRVGDEWFGPEADA